MKRSIGVIDSGVGGLTVAHELMRQLPKESLIYLGDTKRCPYGPRPEDEVKKFTWDLVEFLQGKAIKMLVVACNTATAFTLHDLQNKLDIPVVGVIQPGARAAIKSTKNSHIGVIGTEGTIRSNAYPEALKDTSSDIHVDSLACPLFVPLVERGILSGRQAEMVVSETLYPLTNESRIDTLILGCTHYPLLKHTIREVTGNHVSIISSSEETARETSTILELYDLLYTGEEPPSHEFYTTGELSTFSRIAKGIFSQTFNHVQSVTMDKAIICST